MLAPLRSLTSALVLTGIVVLVGSAFASSTNFDFRAFYCAGTALRQHADPYHTEPLHTCESKGTDAQLSRFTRQIIVPAPQPGYDLAVFALFSYMPFTVAAKAWTLLVLLCSALSIVALQRLSRLPTSVVTVALWLSVIVPSIFLGELIPLCMASVAFTALYAKSERWALSGACAAITLIEPHVGLPVCLVMFLFAPRARLSMCLSLLVLGIASLAAIGFEWNVEYLTTVLPAHALSEIGSDAQLSVSVALHWLGLPDRIALRLGTLLYVVTAGMAVYIAHGLVKRFSDGSFLVTVPAAFAVMGGVFIHVTEAAFAVPLLLLLVQRLGSKGRLAVFGIVLLSVPWWSLATPMLFTGSTALAMVALTIAFLVWRLSEQNAKAALASGAVAALIGAVLVLWHTTLSVPFTSINPPANVFSATYPEANWAWFNTTYMSTGSPPTWCLRVLTWLGLFCGGFQALVAALDGAKHVSGLRTPRYPLRVLE